MKVHSVKYKTINDLTLVKNKFSSRPQHTLIQVFCGIPEEETISQIINDINATFPGTPMIGTTTAGEIYKGKSLSGTIIVSIVEFEKAKTKSGIVRTNNNLSACGRQLSKQLCDLDSHAMIVFGCGIKNGEVLDGEPLMDGIQSVNPNLIVAGAQAGDNGLAEKTLVFTEQGMTDTGVVAATISRHSIVVKNHFTLSWIPIGKKFTVTHAEGNRIYSLNNKPAKEVFSYYLGPEFVKGLPTSSADFPLIVDRFGNQIARIVNKVHPDGSINFMSSFYTGEQVQFSYCHSGLLAKGISDTMEQFNKLRFDVVFAYSCSVRKWVLGEDIQVELLPLSRIAPSCGFFAYGEYFHRQMKNHFFSHTLTILGISENPSADPIRISSNIVPPEPYDTKHLSTLRVLHHLVEVSTNEILEVNEKLNTQANIDSLTGLANRRNLENSILMEMKRLSRSNSEELFSAIMLDLDFFKKYNDTYGHAKGDDVLRTVSYEMRKCIRRPGDLVARYGGEEFIVILPGSSHDGAMHIAESIRAAIENLQIPHENSPEFAVVTASFGVATLTIDHNKELRTEEVYTTCDKQLYISKNLGRNRISGIDNSLGGIE